MTTPTSDEPFPPLADIVATEPAPPFDDQVTFELDKPVQLAQLSDEIAAALKRDISVAMLGPDDPGSIISPTNVATLAVSPSSIDKGKVQTAIDDHEPVDGYDVPAYEKQFSELLDRVVNDPTIELSVDDQAIALRGLLLRENRRESGT